MSITKVQGSDSMLSPSPTALWPVHGGKTGLEGGSLRRKISEFQYAQLVLGMAVSWEIIFTLSVTQLSFLKMLIFMTVKK